MTTSDPVKRVRNDAFEKAAPELAQHAEAIRALGRRALSDVVEIGERLAKAKQLIGHGHWLAWLKAEFGWTDETARRFMDSLTPGTLQIRPWIASRKSTCSLLVERALPE